MRQRLKNFRHNMVAHPIAGVFWVLGYQETGDWVHNNW